MTADQPAVLEAARQRGDRVEDVDGEAERLAADLRDGRGLPQLAAAQGAERPDRRVGAPVESRSRPSRVRKPIPAVAACASDAPPRDREEVVEQRVAEVGVRRARGPVQLTTQPTSWVEPSASVTRSPPPVSGSASATVPVQVAQPVDGGELAQDRGRARGHPVPDAVPVAGVGGEELGAVLLREPLPELADPEPQAVHGRAPVATGRARRARRARRRAARSSASVEPQSSTSGMAASWSSSACRAGSSPLRDTAQHPPVVTSAGPGERQDDVDHGEAGADEQDVARADPVAAYDVEGAGRPRVGDEERGGGEALRRPVVAGGRQPGGDDHGVGGEVVAVVEEHGRPGGVATQADGTGADVAQRRGGGGQVERVGRGSRRGSGRTGAGARRWPGSAPVACSCRARQATKWPGSCGQRGHAGRGDVEQVLVVGGAEGGAPAGTVGGVHHDDVDAGAALVRRAGEVERDEGARRTAADDHDLGTTRPRGTLRHDIPP